MAYASLPWPSKKSTVKPAGLDVIWQVGFPANALANAIGALMATSRWRVCVAMWFQAVVLPGALAFLIYHLGNMTGVVSWVLALG